MSTAARKQFNRQAARYDNQWASWSDATLHAMLQWAEPQPHWQVLDIATGTGFGALAFAPDAAHKAFHITTDHPITDSIGETRFAWQRVLLRARKETV